MENNTNMKDKHILLLLVLGIWMIDFFSTVFFINGDYGMHEANTIPALFFSYGMAGYIIYFIFIVCFLSFIILKLPILLTKDEVRAECFRWFISGSVIGMEILVLTLNLKQLGWWF